MKKAVLVAAVAAACAAPVVAQEMPESYRQVQINALEAQRRMLITMADSMPERLYRDKATPAQRDFAGQVLHVAQAMPFILRHTTIVTAGPTGLPDTAATLNTRAGLKQYVNAVYDWAVQTLRSQTAAQRSQTLRLFGQAMPGWQVWDEINQHAWWTGGQMVANFRKNGMNPPGFGFF